MESNYFILFANCIPVKGARRSIICDLQRNSYVFIPNGLYDILSTQSKNSIREIKESFSNQSDEIIDNYFSFLLKKDFGFYGSKTECNQFPKLDLFWDEPYSLSNAIIDINETSGHNYKKILNELDTLSCAHIQLRFFSEYKFSEIITILGMVESTKIKSCDIFMKFDDKIKIDDLEALCSKFSKINTLYLHSCPTACVYKISDTTMGNILFVNDVIDSSSHCGIIHSNYFNVTLKMFAESKMYNSCLNRKIGIDINGNIKNCPTFDKSFGNIRYSSINSIIKDKEFQKLWNINKDQINVCKDCEFRYICSDCRAIIEDKQNIFSKPLKCTYNPYTATWEN